MIRRMNIFFRVFMLCLLVRQSQALGLICNDERASPRAGCFWLESGKATFLDALINCSLSNGTLAVVDHWTRHEFIKERGLIPSEGAWVGLTDKVTKGVLRWTNGKVQKNLHYGFANFGQPSDNNENTGDCVAYDSHKELDVFNCSTLLPFICQRVNDEFYCKQDDPECAPWINMELKPTNESTATCDDQLILDANETNLGKPFPCATILCQTSVYFICQVIKLGGSLCRGYGRTLSELNETHCTSTTNDSAMEIFTRNFTEPDHPLEVINVPKTQISGTWFQAKQACKDEGLQLLTVKSTKKNANISSIGNISSWMALRDHNVEGVYRWDDGAYGLYANWVSGHPLISKDINCAFRSEDSQWWSAKCDEYKPYVCEVPLVGHCLNVNCSGHGTCESLANTYRCHCTEGHTGEHCEIIEESLLFTYVTILLKYKYHDDLADLNSLRSRALMAAMKEEVAEKLLQLVHKQLGFINVVHMWPNDRRDSTYVTFEIGTESNRNDFDVPMLKTLIHLSFLNALGDGYLERVPHEASFVSMGEPMPEKDECAERPCGDQGRCIDGARTFTCECYAGYRGETCSNSPFSPVSPRNIDVSAASHCLTHHALMMQALVMMLC
jgi:hypothetical protein